MSDPAKAATTYNRVGVGDPAPWFRQSCSNNPNFTFSTVGGRYIVLGFFVTGADDASQALLKAVDANRDLFDDQRMSFFGVTTDPEDQSLGRVRENLPGIRHFWDFDGSVSRTYGAIPVNSEGRKVRAQRFCLVLDPALRVMAKFPMTRGETDFSALFDYLKALPPVDRYAGFEIPAPILVLPNVFEPELCRRLIETYETEGGVESGFMREVDGKTVRIEDHNHKRRRDCTITDPDLIAAIQARIHRRVGTEIKKVYSFSATRMERYIVGCYAAEDNAHFRAHRDNTTTGTAHRRFAVSINLNSDFAGGEVSFPEYGSRSYKAPPGGAVIFPCALLHAVSKVTEGRRYAFLPFLYDEEAARIREENARFLEGGSSYRAGRPNAA